MKRHLIFKRLKHSDPEEWHWHGTMTFDKRKDAEEYAEWLTENGHMNWWMYDKYEVRELSKVNGRFTKEEVEK